MSALDELFWAGYIPWMVDRVTKALIDARKEAGLTQRQVADALGMGRPTLCDIESGRRPFPRKHAGKLPPQIRNQVISAAIQELAEEAAELTAMMWKGTPE